MRRRDAMVFNSFYIKYVESFCRRVVDYSQSRSLYTFLRVFMTICTSILIKTRVP